MENCTEADKSFIQQLVDGYFKELFPDNEVPITLALRENKIHLDVNLPYFPAFEQKTFLEGVEHDLGETLGESLRLKDNLCLSANFKKPKQHYLERYPLFQSHIDLAHKHWKSLVNPGDTVIDATCGNGHDTLVLAQIALTTSTGQLYACDVQKKALLSTEQMLREKLDAALIDRLHFVHGCHSSFPSDIEAKSVKLIVYNLGYLPGGDKSKTTSTETSLQSIQRAQELIADGGLISITCYPGHPEGKREEEHILEYISTLNPRQWSCCSHRWSNRSQAPSLLLIQKSYRV